MRTRIEGVDVTLPPRDAGLPAGRWLCSGLRAAILGGRLRPGARLPATRDLAARYGLSRGTVVAAFEQMKSEGSLTAQSGSGTYVSAVLPDSLLEVRGQPPAARSVRSQRPRRLSDTGGRPRPLSAPATPPPSALPAPPSPPCPF